MNIPPERRRPARGQRHGRGASSRVTVALLGLFLATIGAGCITPPAWSTTVPASPAAPGSSTLPTDRSRLQPTGTANGSVELEGTPVDGESARKDPVRCEFTVRFHGFDEGTNTAAVTFRAWPPTAEQSPMTTNEGDLAFTFQGSGESTGTADELDHTEDYRLDTDAFEPNDQGNVHVRMDVLVTDSGGQTLKQHITFWLRPCGARSYSIGALDRTASAPSPTTNAAGTIAGPNAAPTPGPTSFDGGIERPRDAASGTELAWFAVIIGLGVAGIGLIRLLKPAGQSGGGA